MPQHLPSVADLRGTVRLTTDAVVGITGVVEAMHSRIARPLRVPSLGPHEPADERTRGITGFVYRAVRGVTRGVGAGADTLLGGLERLQAAPDPHEPPHLKREGLVSALNGVLGDHLAARGNPLAITMSFRREGRPLPLERSALRTRIPDATPKLLVLLHGLCMNDLQWRRAGHDHGEALARELGYTPVYLHYNSGLDVTTNGRRLAQLMEQLVDAWPVPTQRLVMIGHSMGGLVARSAIHQGASMQPEAMRWPARVDSLVCLGTPHQGAPLERAGHGVDLLLGAMPFAAPLARIGKVRSAGINDLRHGTVMSSPCGAGRRRRAEVALPGGTRCYAIAASLGTSAASVKTRWLGDGLVPVASALGWHRDPGRRLAFAEERQAVVSGTGHLDLLSSAEAHDRLRAWLA